MNIASVLESIAALFWVGIGVYILYKTRNLCDRMDDVITKMEKEMDDDK